MVGRVRPRHRHRGRPLNSVVRLHNSSGTIAHVMAFLRRFVIGLALALPAYGAADSVTHAIQSQLFEIFENGALSNKRVSLDIFAVQNGGVSRAQCQFAVITINNKGQYLSLDMFSASTDDSTIRDLQIDKGRLSFEMTPFPLAPDRPIRVVATRGHGPGGYKVGVTGVWTGLMDKSSLIKIEWKQVPSIALPYNTIRR